MSRRDPLVGPVNGDSADEYRERVRAAIVPGNELSIRVGPALSFSTGESAVSAALWMNVGTRSESWQKVSVTVMSDNYAEALAFMASVLEDEKAVTG